MEIEVSSIQSVYSGRPGCSCGCLGKYTYASAHRDEGSVERGRMVLDEEVSDKTVRRIVKILQAHADQLFICENHVALYLPKWKYVAYFTTRRPPPVRRVRKKHARKKAGARPSGVYAHLVEDEL